MAMGFPCTGSKGKIDVTGHLYAPKMLSFALPNSCPMAHSSNDIQAIIQKNYGLSTKASLLSYAPLAVLYWELVDVNDAGTGYVVDLRSTEAKRQLWTAFQAKKPIKLRLYGRENTWTAGSGLFEVQASLINTDNLTFSLEVSSALPLTKTAKDEVRDRCLALVPPRNCEQVFF
jgi:hypothetical protein